MKTLYRLATIEKSQTTPRLVIDRFERDLAQAKADKAALLTICVLGVLLSLIGIGVLP